MEENNNETRNNSQLQDPTQNQNSNVNNVFSNEEKQYPSGEFVFSVIQKEYDYETARKNALETRSGILITLAAAILTFVFSNIKIPNIKSPIDDFPDLILYVSYFLIAIIAMASVVISLCYLLRVIFIAEYSRFDIDSITQNIAEQEPDLVAYGLAKKYQEIITDNHKTNHNKALLYRKGTNYLIASLFSSVILYAIAINL